MGLQERLASLFFRFMIHSFDLLILVVALAAFFYGLYRGFVIELASIVGIFIGTWGASQFSFHVEEWLTDNADMPGVGIIAFAITFVAILFVVHFLARVIHKVVGMVMLGSINRILGGLLCTLKVLFIASCVLFFVNRFFGDSIEYLENAKESSVLFGYVSDFAPKVIPFFESTLESIGGFESIVG